MGINDFTVYDAVKRSAACYGDNPAWFEADDNRSLSFIEFKQEVDRLAYGLLESGVSRGDRIGVLGKNCLEYFLLFGAAAAVGAIMLPINWRLSADEVAYNLHDCEPKLVFTDAEFRDLIAGIETRLPSVKEFFNLRPSGNDLRDLSSLTDNSGNFNPPDVSTDDGFVIIHTAAVSGKPRGALLSHGNMVCAHIHLSHHLRITPQDVHLNILPLFHIGGLVLTTNSLHAGALTVNMSKFDAAKAVKLIQEKRVSHLMEFAPILASILDQQEKTNEDITSLRAVMGLDASGTIEKYQEVTGGVFYSIYAQTETSCLGTLATYDERPGSAGKPVMLAQIALLEDNGDPVPVGEVGEISLRGPMAFKGYWNLPEDNSHTFRGGWHHTGDMGRFDEHGYLWYEGRKAEKELIKPGGENVYPAEVEAAILQHPSVERVIVFGVPDPKWKEGIKAVCQLKHGESLTDRELIDFVGERIARYKKPQYVEFVSALPLKADGTPDRRKAKELYSAA